MQAAPPPPPPRKDRSNTYLILLAGATVVTAAALSFVPVIRKPAVDADSDHITGTAGSPGTVEGEVFVVHSPADFSSFPDGAILVARTTNPAWTALFYQAGGVITESGGALSHGAVTARELGLPAVMAVRDATSRFTSGQRVRVDGSNGNVIELD